MVLVFGGCVSLLWYGLLDKSLVNRPAAFSERLKLAQNWHKTRFYATCASLSQKKNAYY